MENHFEGGRDRIDLAMRKTNRVENSGVPGWSHRGNRGTMTRSRKAEDRVGFADKE